MTQLIPDDEQVKAVAQAAGTVELCDQRGNIVGYVARGPLQRKSPKSNGA